MADSGESQQELKDISEDEVSECISEKIDEGWDQERAVATCLNMAREGSSEPEKSVEDVDTQPTQEMADIASEVLEKIDDPEFDNDECGTQTGLERANQLENRENLSEDTINRMVSFFARHDGNQEVNEDVDSKWEDCGFVAWQLWGGDPGRDWAERKQEELEEAREDPNKEIDTMQQKTDQENMDDVKTRSFRVKGSDIEVVKNEGQGPPVVNVPIQALEEDRDGDFINEKGQESIIRQLKQGTVPMVPNHGFGNSTAHYGFEDIFGQFVDGENRNGTTIGTARLREGHEMTDELIDLLEQDMPVGFSVGFQVLEADPREKEGSDGLEISEVDLMEVSAVGIPSNPEAVPQAMGGAVAMAKQAGLEQQEILEKVKSAFETDTMSEKQEDTENVEGENPEKGESTEQKQFSDDEVQEILGVVGGALEAHMNEALQDIESELQMEESEEEETDEMDEDEEDEEMAADEDDEEEMSEEPEKSTDEQEAEKSSEPEESEETELEKTAEKNKEGVNEIKTVDESEESEEDGKEKSQEEFDPFKPDGARV